MKTKTKTKKLSDEENLKMAYELKNLASDWVETFNFIQIDVLEAIAERDGTSVIEHIRQEPLDPSGYVYDLSVKEREQLFEEYQEDTGDNTNLAEGLHQDFLDWVEENKASELKGRRDKTMATIDISKMVFHEGSLSNSASGELAKVYKVGYTEYKEYSEDPSYGRALDFLTMFAHIVPNEMYDAAKAIHERHLQDTIEFWKQFEKSAMDAPRVYNTVDLTAK